MAVFTWLFIVIVGAWGATLITCNCIVMATESERPRWYIALMRMKIGRRIG